MIDLTPKKSIRLRRAPGVHPEGEGAKGLRRDGTTDASADVPPKPEAKADELWHPGRSPGSSIFSRLEWKNVSFLAGAHMAAVVGSFFWFSRGHFNWPTIALTLFMTAATGMAITVGYHRLFSHKAFSSHWIVRLLLLLFGAAAFQNSAKRWASDHRRHHKFVDTEKDPYNIKEGFLFAHIGWVLVKYQGDHSYDDVPDLDDDLLVRLQEKFYVLLAILMSFVFPVGIAMIWGDPLGGFFMAGWLRLIINEHFTFFINSAAHTWGTQPYSNSDTSRDNALLALVTYGEGYHNFHHKFPFDYRNGLRLYQWDPSRWAIKFLSIIGLAGGLRRTPKTAILRARLAMDEKRLLEKMARMPLGQHSLTAEFIRRTREKFEIAHAEFQRHKMSYKKLKTEKLVLLKAHLDSMNVRLAEVKSAIHQAELRFLEARAAWHEICRRFGISPTRA